MQDYSQPITSQVLLSGVSRISLDLGLLPTAAGKLSV